MFTPDLCPNRICARHYSPGPKFFRRIGFYKPKCRPWPVPRFQCLTCRRTFSRQTFRADYRDHKPHLNLKLTQLLVSGVGLRQASRILNLTLRCTELKARKVAKQAQYVNLNLRGQFVSPTTFQFDDVESYETKRRERPLTFPILIEPESRFIVWGESGQIAPKGRMSARRIQANHAEQATFGRRIDKSDEAVRQTLERAVSMVASGQELLFQTDEKVTYPRLIRSVFERNTYQHRTTSSRMRRDKTNPLFPFNQTEAVARDLMGRLRRKSWLASKKSKYLDLAWQLFMAWKNYSKPRFNRDQQTPAQLAGFVGKRIAIGELLGWRQDWGVRSPKLVPGISNALFSDQTALA